MPNNETFNILSCKCGNTESDLIIITHDKLYNILFKHRKKIGIKIKWISPLTLFITILLSLLTGVENKEILGLPKEIWTVIFIIGAIVTFIWLIIMIVMALMYSKDSTIDSLIDKIKGNKKTKCVHKECTHFAKKLHIDNKVISALKKDKAFLDEDRKESIIDSLIDSLTDKIKEAEATKCIYIEEGCPLYDNKLHKSGKVIAFLRKIKRTRNG